MKIKKTIIIALALTLTTSVFAAGGKRGRGHFKKVIQSLELSKEQMVQLKAARKENSNERKELRTELQEKRKALKSAFASNKSKGQLRTMHREMKKLRNRMADLRFNKLLKLREVLTPAQRSKFQTAMNEMRQKRRGHRSEEFED